MATSYKGKRTATYSPKSKLLLFAAGAGICLILVLLLFALDGGFAPAAEPEQPSLSDMVSPEPSETPAETPQQPSVPEETPEEPEEIYEEEPEDLVYEDFTPHAVAGTEPSSHILSTDVLVGGQIVSDYRAENPIQFDVGSKYTALDGLFTFRGDNFRSGSSVGTADLTSKTFGEYWTHSVTTLAAPDGNVWTGCGWTGQPLIVNWPKATRQIMNLHDWAKEADELIEVIYATMDGHIYFLELETGKETRDPLFMGYTFKGSGSIDPRGYPVLYVGAGYASTQGSARAFAISLIDYSVLFTFGNDDSFALRDWPCFDSSPLVDAETDQLIYPGENGVLYLVHLNSSYDEAAGTLTMDPEIVRWRYQGARSSTTSYWFGMEDSAVIWQGHLIVADNGGYLMCLDLETLKLDWVQDVVDDTNCSPVLELEDGHPYIYISTSFHLGWRSSSTAEIPVFKIDAETGEIVWQVDYTCYSEDGVSGGVQGTIALGKKKLSNLVFVPVSRSGQPSGGILAALDKETGEKIWEWESASYTWGSPTIVYDKAGNGYLIFGTLYGELCMLDGATGEVLDTMDMGAHMESTVAAYGNHIVIGTRTNYIYGITLE